jgi:ASPM-SPD-2-Hydin domain-containing protein
VKTPLYRLAPVLFLTIWMAGCAGTVGSPNAATSPAPDPAPKTHGQLGVTPSTINFGNVAVGSSASQSATLTATDADVQVSSAAWNGQGYSLGGITFPVTVPAGKSVSLKVNFAPTTAGSTPGKVTFASDASDASLIANLTGTGTSSGGATQHSVTLSWSPSNSSVAGYNIYRGTVSGGPYTLINASLDTATVYTDATVQAAKTYFYVATSVDSSQNESAFSNQTTANVPQ